MIRIAELENLPTLKDFYVDDLAKILFISTRSLHRKLGQQNISFQKLFDKERKRRCFALLQQPAHSASLIYEELRFTDVKCFYRAFSRWAGISYSEYKINPHQTINGDIDSNKPRLLLDSEKNKIGGGMASVLFDDQESDDTPGSDTRSPADIDEKSCREAISDSAVRYLQFGLIAGTVASIFVPGGWLVRLGMVVGAGAGGAVAGGADAHEYHPSCNTDNNIEND